MADKPKPKVDIAMLFGKPKGGDMGMGDDAEARDMLKSASGWDDATIDALHEYIRACQMEESGEGMHSAGEEATEAEGY
jgi:hypothetical protein